MSQLVITLYGILGLIIVFGGLMLWCVVRRGSGLPEMVKPQGYVEWKSAPDSRTSPNCRCVGRPLNVNPPPTYAKPPAPQNPPSARATGARTKPHLVKLHGYWWPMASRNDLPAREATYIDDICAAHHWASFQNMREASFKRVMKQAQDEVEMREATWGAQP